MGPLPKRKHSISRKNRRRAHDALSLKKLIRCEGCGELHQSHYVCPTCGTYKGETVVEVATDK